MDSQTILDELKADRDPAMLARRHREQALAKARASADYGQQACATTAAWLRAIGGDETLIERADQAMRLMQSIDRMLDPDKHLDGV